MEEEQRYSILYEIAQELNSDLAPQAVLNTIVKALCHAASAKGCSLMLLSADGQQLVHSIAYGLSDWYVQKGPVMVVDTDATKALSGEPVLILNATSDSRVRYREEAKKEGVVSILSLPFARRGKVIGIVRVYTSEPHRFPSGEIEFFSALANLGAVALERAELLEEQKKQFLRFVSIAAHDLKAPLSAIQSFFGVMLGGFAGELNEKQKHMMQRASERINELLMLISDLLDIPRIERDQLLREVSQVSLAQIISSTVEEYGGPAKQKGLELVMEIPEDLPPVNGSLTRLKQVLDNLVNNAINYTSEGKVNIRASEADGEVLVEVSDTGCGIQPDELPRVFDDFFRGSNVQAKGTGLGLSIAKRVIEAHGGRIWAESPCSETGKGSRFYFALPKLARTTGGPTA